MSSAPSIGPVAEAVPPGESATQTLRTLVWPRARSIATRCARRAVLMIVGGFAAVGVLAISKELAAGGWQIVVALTAGGLVSAAVWILG